MRAGWTTASLVALTMVAHAEPSASPQKQAAPLPTMQEFASAVASSSPKARRDALKGLRDHGGPETLVLLASLVGDPEVDIREGAVSTVIDVYVPSAKKRLASHTPTSFDVARFRAQVWPVPVELNTALVKALADDEPVVRRDAAYAVGIVLTPPVSDTAAFELTSSLSDREPSVRIAAARALGRLQVKSAGAELIGRVNDEDLDVRLAAMRALEDLREERAVKALADQFSFYVRGVAGRAAISALAAIGHPSSVALFEAQSTSRYPAHRWAAYEGLARSGRAAAIVPRIEAAKASEKDSRVRTAMAFALASAGKEGVNQIIDALADRNDAEAALTYLIDLGRPQVPAIAARLSDPNPVVREQIAIALGFIGGPEAVGALKGASREAEPAVRNAIDIASVRGSRATR
jgi:HEAT repeat protein